QPRVLAQAHAVADDDVRADVDAIGKADILRHDGRRMNLDAHGERSTIEARSSPCAQRVPSTQASPRIFQTFERCCITSTRKSSLSPGTTGCRNFALSMPRKYMRLRSASKGSDT